LSKEIPHDIEGCMQQIDKLFDDSTKAVCQRISKESEAIEFNNKYSETLQNSWGLWTTVISLTKYFYLHGVTSPKDMTLLIFNSYHKKINNQPIDFYRQLSEYFKKNNLPYHPKPVSRFKIGDTLEWVNSGSRNLLARFFDPHDMHFPNRYFFTAIIKDLDTVTNKINISIVSIEGSRRYKPYKVHSVKLYQHIYEEKTSYWDDATRYRGKNWDALAIDVD